MIIDATNTQLGILAVIVFAIAYLLVISEEFTRLRKSKPVLLAAGIIWLIVAIIANKNNISTQPEIAVKHTLLEYGELFLFLLVAMTYVNVMQEYKIFEALRSKLVNFKLNLRQLFWITGIIAFFLSPLVDNLTTALIMGAVVIAAGEKHPKFVALACINIVVAANAGGAFSPFGDITTLMVWQSGKLPFTDFFKIFIPAAVSYIVPAFVMSLYIPPVMPEFANEKITIVKGGITIIWLFALTIFTAVSFHVWFNLPPVIGMMTGLGYLHFFRYYLNRANMNNSLENQYGLASVEWDTLLFFYGIMMCIGGLAAIGYLEYLSKFLYEDLNFGLSLEQHATPANVILGLLSAIIHNIPVLYSVLTMNPVMSEGQWLLITLTTGLGGSILAIGSAAGVALMGQTRKYTFFSHLKWSPLIIIGYAAGVLTHLWLNESLF